MDYVRGRRLLLVLGLAIMGLVLLWEFYRRVDVIEVIATMFFIPVFIAFVFWGVRGGLLGGAAAAVGYIALRAPAIQTVGETWFIGTIAGRALTFPAFGLIGGWASRQMSASLTKLELYDHIDDETELYNARYFIEELDVQIARVKRYQSVFSIAALILPESALSDIPKRKRSALLRGVGRLLRESVRIMDRACHGSSRDRHHIAAILPETGKDGARIFVERLADGIVQFASSLGIRISVEQLSPEALGFPEDEQALERLRQSFVNIDRTMHPAPEAAVTPGGPPRTS